MGKLLIASILLVPALLARHAASVHSARRGLRRVVLLALAYTVLYAFGLVYLYFRLT